MTDYLTILGNVAGAIFSPFLALLVTLAVMGAALIWAFFSGSKEAAFAWWGTALSWAVFAVVLTGGVSLLFFLTQFTPFAWAVLS
jgi:hypothetical protein